MQKFPETFEEKLDYVYEAIRRDSRDKTFELIWKWSWRAVLIISLGYMYLHPDYLVNQVKEQTSQMIPTGMVLPEGVR